MSVGVMEDYTLRDLRASHTLGPVGLGDTQEMLFFMRHQADIHICLSSSFRES
jgi:hypothetical protein